MSEFLDRVDTLHPQAGEPFEVALSGAKGVDTALIMVHGFGVDRDARGIFPDLAAATGEAALAVRPDFTIRGAEANTAIPFNQQIARLHRAIKYSREELRTQRQIFVGHSQGSLVVALAGLEQQEGYLLAPPLGDVYDNFIATPGCQRPGSSIALEPSEDSRLVRSDGSVTLVPHDFWPDLIMLGNVDPYIQDFAIANQAKIYFAGKDNVLGHQEAPQGVESAVIPNANHDFIGDARQNLVRRLVKDFEL